MNDNELITPEVKSLINFLNVYAFVAWSLMEHGDLGIEYLTEIAEKETDEYKTLLEEFNNAKLRVIEEARKKNDAR